MRVLFVAPWGVPCGIATYTEQLASALDRDVEVAILAEDAEDEEAAERGAIGPDSSIVVERSWSRWDGAPRRLIEWVGALGPDDIVHVQHEYGIWPFPTAFRGVVDAAHSVGAKVVLTAHTPDPQVGGAIWRDAFRAVDRIVVHSMSAARAMSEWGAAREPPDVIHHGVRAHPLTDQAEARKHLALPLDRQLCVSVGFLNPGKRIDELICGAIRGMALRQDRHKTTLVLAGKLLTQDHDPEYWRRVTASIVASGYSDRIILRPNFVPDSDVGAYYSAADFAAINYPDGLLGVSGAAHTMLGYGLPVLARDTEPFACLDERCAVKFKGERDMALGWIRLTMSADLRRTLAEGARAIASERTWTQAAAAHVELYSRLLG